MEVFIGRQPIFNKEEKIVAYELLYRSKNQNYFTGVDSDAATVDVLINSFLSIGIEEVTKGRPGFVNFTENLLMSRLTDLLNPEQIVVEILEDVAITDKLIERVIELKKQGYRVALDDFVLEDWQDMHDVLFSHIDFIKVDFMLTTLAERSEIERRVQRDFPHITLLAEKVETREEFEIAKVSGYELFQGYFFEQPQVITSTDIPPNTMQSFQLISLLKEEEPDMDIVAENIERDISLTYKLLHLINSSSKRKRSKVRSIKQAVMIMGISQLRNWIYLLAMREGNKNTDTDTFQEIMHSALFRAKVCEMLAKYEGKPNYSEYFLVGMFSLIDSLLQRPMHMILNQMPFSEEIIETISGGKTELTPYLDLAIALDKVDWETIDCCIDFFDIPVEEIDKIYAEANEWAENAFD